MLRKPLCTVCRPPPELPKLALIRIRERATSSASTARRRRTVFSCTEKLGSWYRVRGRGAARRARRASPSASPAAVAVAARAVGAVDHVELLERAARADGDAGQRRLGEVGRHLGLVARDADLLARQDDGLRQSGDHVAAADLGLELLRHRERRADLELELRGGLLADQQLVL